jgi:tetratricopeptide (TPR) repeat protein
VPLQARFSDGTIQVQNTERLQDFNVLRFESAAKLKEVRLDPDSALALIVPPPQVSPEDVERSVEAMDWTNVGKRAQDLYKKAGELKLTEPRTWLKLGLTLFDGGYYQESLEAFERASDLNKQQAWLVVWQGMLLDLLGQRPQAIARYQKALAIGKGINSTHDQYGLRIDRKWVEARLTTPFQRKSSQ